MFDDNAKKVFNEVVTSLREQGLYKEERIIFSPQGSHINVKDGDVLNFCANNYLGLSSHPSILSAAVEGVNKYGYGMSSVRFICGTQDIHKELEANVSKFLGTEDTILYTSCFDANTGFFESFLGKKDAIISDQLNHASIIDGVRLCKKAERRIYKHNNMEELETALKETQDKRFRVIATDGVFSMLGDLANLPEICALAEKYNALVFVDDSHATGFVGKTGRGTPEFFNVQDKVDIVTSTLGKALGGASGGFTSGKKEIIELLRQKSRPYMFSNTVPPVVAYTAAHALKMLMENNDQLKKVKSNTEYFREKMTELGFDFSPGEHPIVSIFIGEAIKAQEMAKKLLSEGVYVIGFGYPIVAKGKARVRVQVSAAHSQEDLDKAIAAFAKVGKELEIIK
jgi:glycine C-acetyltransferase